MSESNHIAKELGELLDRFAAELDEAVDPDQTAMRSLGLTRAGTTERAYSDEAFDIWDQRYKRDSKDVEAVHHLAIMHHARAIDRERGTDPTESDSDWTEAMRHWHELWQSDVFWASTRTVLKSKNDKGDPIAELRSEFPALYLQVHYDIATDEETRAARVKYHVKSVLDSPFPADAKEHVRRTTYSRYVTKIPDSIWSNATPEVEQAKQAGEVIRSYLRIDPDYREALGDALRILDRLLQTRVGDINAIGQVESERKPFLTELRTVAEIWLPYLKPLADDIESLTPDMRRDLCHWAFLNGQVCQGLERDNDAVEMFGLGEQVASPGEPQRLRCARNRITMEAKIARDKAASGASGARNYAEKIAQRDDLIPLACFLLAQGFQALEEFDRAEALCDRCAQIEPEKSDYNLLEEDENNQQMTLQLREAITAARSHTAIRDELEKQRFTAALKLANTQLAQKPDDDVCLFLRVQANMGVNNLDDAVTDLTRFRATETGQGSEARKAADALQEQINRLKLQVLHGAN